MNSQQMEEMLWNYIDGNCTEAEQAEIESLLQDQPNWKSKYDELLAVHELIHATTLDEPSLRFTQNVMEEIAQFHIAPATRTYINKKIIYGIGGFFLVMIAGLLVYTFSQINWSDSSSASPYNIDRIEWSQLFSSSYVKIFMMMNIILGLMLLDNFLHRKKDEYKV